jgi:lia operon protein LiaF
MSTASRNLVWSIVLIVVGVLFLAHNLGYIRFSQLTDLIGTWWPVILIAVGAAGLIQRGR